jgi:hypothetical protein
MLAEEKEQQTALPAGGLRGWIMNHDNSWLFIVPYIGLAVTLSIVISLFWLIVVVAAHFILEFIRQWILKPGWLGVLSRSIWELKLDIGLVLFGLVLGLYMEFTLGVVGLGAAGRAGAMTGARFLVLQRVLRGILLSLDDLAQVLRVVFRRKAANGDTEEAVEEAIEEARPEEVGNPWSGRWSLGDRISLGFAVICLVMIVLAPIITHHTFDSTIATLLEELHPWPTD